jgi:Cupin-like domain
MGEFDSDVWEHHYSQNLPFVLKLVKGSLPCLDWTIESLSALAGDEGFVLYETRGDTVYAARSDMIIRKLNMREISKLLLNCNESNRYQIVTDVKSIPAFYDQALLTKKFFPEIHPKIVQCNMWLNLGKFMSGFHYDCLENLNLQVKGTKHFVLYEPGIKNFYARGLFTAKGHTSEVVDPDNYDRDKYLNFDLVKDKRHDVILNSGEMLYLPLSWWHNVISSGDMNLNLNYWWINAQKSATRYPRQFLSGIITVLYRKLTNQLY